MDYCKEQSSRGSDGVLDVNADTIGVDGGDYAQGVTDGGAKQNGHSTSPTGYSGMPIDWET